MRESFPYHGCLTSLFLFLQLSCDYSTAFTEPVDNAACQELATNTPVNWPARTQVERRKNYLLIFFVWLCAPRTTSFILWL